MGHNDEYVTISLPLQPQEEARLVAVARAKGLSTDALVREALERILAEASAIPASAGPVSGRSSSRNAGIPCRKSVLKSQPSPACECQVLMACCSIPTSCSNCAGSGLKQRLQPDLIIAATAVQHGLTVVTRDRGDYDRAGYRCESVG